MNYSKLKVLVCGVGSVGERHISNLLKLGITNIWAVRETDRKPRIINKGNYTAFKSLDHALDTHKYDFAIVSNPTSKHCETALKLIDSKIPVLIEKPISISVDESELIIESVRRNGVLVGCGYMYRYHPLLIHLKKLISTNVMGAVINYKSIWSEYLPDWHPWEEYKESYAAKRSLGGGVVLTLSHDIDIALWLFGTPKAVESKLFSGKNLQIDVEERAEITLNYVNLNIEILLDYSLKKKERKYICYFEKGKVELDLIANELIIQSTEGKEIIKSDVSRDNLFELELKNFIHSISDEEKFKCKLIDATSVVEICEKIFKN